MNKKIERTKVLEYYDSPQQFLDELNSIPTRKLTSQSDKDLIKKLKRWVREYWGENGESFILYETHYARLQIFLKELETLNG